MDGEYNSLMLHLYYTRVIIRFLFPSFDDYNPRKFSRSAKLKIIVNNVKKKFNSVNFFLITGCWIHDTRCWILDGTNKFFDNSLSYRIKYPASGFKTRIAIIYDAKDFTGQLPAVKWRISRSGFKFGLIDNPICFGIDNC